MPSKAPPPVFFLGATGALAQDKATPEAKKPTAYREKTGTITATIQAIDLEKRIVTDPLREALQQHTRFVPLQGGLESYHLFALLAPHMESGGRGNFGNVVQTSWGKVLTAHKGAEWLVLAAAGLIAREAGVFSILKSDARIGKQADGVYLLPTNQLLRPWGEQTLFPGRPVDLAMDLAMEVFPTPGGPTRQRMGPLILFVRPCTARYSRILSLGFFGP